MQEPVTQVPRVDSYPGTEVQALSLGSGEVAGQGGGMECVGEDLERVAVPGRGRSGTCCRSRPSLTSLPTPPTPVTTPATSPRASQAPTHDPSEDPATSPDPSDVPGHQHSFPDFVAALARPQRRPRLLTRPFQTFTDLVADTSTVARPQGQPVSQVSACALCRRGQYSSQMASAFLRCW